MFPKKEVHMEDEVLFVLNSALLGLGLAMDAFSVSLANGLGEPRMKTARMSLMAGVFAVFQALMPLLGWICIHTVAQKFEAFQKFIPWIALILLSYIGIKMLMEGVRCHKGESEACGTKVGFSALLVQGIATSIDALAVGFTIAEYTWLPAIFCALIIALVTFLICFIGIQIGKRFGVALAGKASIFGGAILVIIGLEIFLTGIFS